MLFSSSYIPHAIYSVAITSISIHLVSQRKTSSDERSRINAQISILENVSEQLRSDKPLLPTELEKLRRLARPPEKSAVEVGNEEVMGWREVFLGKKKSDEGPEMSKWEKKDIEKELGK
ncbi:hypothetical protein Hypma_008968 [Hypsizygus marmoreus]|uniref:Uncharacterized protein n=1 Tax=Hypsizygus marmoreus TaxID=39966 RepID=A0A369JWM5_HYPMA|nr:hypothetical protein Hypma_008968 [Hypsizygus marmoreus]